MGFMNKETIILMGPIGVGKTTQAKLLSKELGMPLCSYDAIKSSYWKELGLSKEKADSIEKKHGLYAMLSYMNEFKSKTIQAIVKEHPAHIIDLGGSAQTFDEPHQIQMIKTLFDPIQNIFLLLPSPDIETSINSLPGLKEDFPINAYLIIHPTNTLFAKYTIYTQGKTPEKIKTEIVKINR